MTSLRRQVWRSEGLLAVWWLAVVMVGGCVGAGQRVERAENPGSAASCPYFDARSKLVEYVGPGRDEPEPVGLAEVKICWFGPDDPAHPTGGDMYRAACLAIDQANRDGGYRGIPLVLRPAWSESPWGAGISRLARLVYDERPWAIVGGPDAPSAHLVEQVVAKARLVFISPVSTDASTNLVNVPWIFSCAPGDHAQAPVLAAAIAAQAGDQGFVLITSTDHDSRLTAAELFKSLSKLKSSPKRHLELTPVSGDLAGQLNAVRDASPGAVVVIAGPADSARLVVALRQAGSTMPVFGGPAMGRRLFLETAGEAAEGVVFPLLWDASAIGEPAQGFRRLFTERFGVVPDYTAAYTYDAVNLFIAAVRQAGLNRARIRDGVRELSGRAGVTGSIQWDPTGQNDRPVGMGTIRGGHIVGQQRMMNDE